jgi:NADH:ubiquinone oxidoreductase subunit 5 (subunit L)/multisubunit Na+/H+ antiporter MnhA subunit
LFVSELTILKGMLETGCWYVAAGYLLALGVIFVAMARLVLPMAFGNPTETLAANHNTPVVQNESAWLTLPPLALGVGSLVLGVYVPSGLWEFLRSVAAGIGAQL